MSNQAMAEIPRRDLQDMHLVFGSGGSKAILSGVGAVLAIHVAGLKKWRTIGGASGGSIPAALLAHDVPLQQILHLVLETDFSKLLTPHTGYLGQMWAFLRKYHYEKVRPVKGVFSHEKMKELVDRYISSWPEKLYIVAACKHGQIIFTRDGGMCKYEPETGERQISRDLPSVGTAVSASCAMPGIIDAVQYRGEYLYDGALSGDGQCPVEPAKRHFGARPDQIVAIDVGEDDAKSSRILRFLWNLSCGGSCGNIDGDHPDESTGTIVVKPAVTGFHGLTFDLDLHHKWRAILCGYVAFVERLKQARIIDDVEHKNAIELALSFKRLLASDADEATFVNRVTAMLSARGLY